MQYDSLATEAADMGNHHAVEFYTNSKVRVLTMEASIQWNLVYPTAFVSHIRSNVSDKSGVG